MSGLYKPTLIEVNVEYIFNFQKKNLYRLIEYCIHV